MDKETKTFIESQNKALLEDVVGVIRDMGETLSSRMDRMETDIVSIKSDVATLKTDVSELKSDVATLKTDVSELKSDVATLKTDVSELKSDVAILQTDVATLKTDVAELKDEVGLNSRVLLRLEHSLQEKAEAQGDDLESVKHRLDRIEDHLKLPRSLAA